MAETFKVGANARELLRYTQRATRLSLIHISEPTRRTPISYAVFCLKKKKKTNNKSKTTTKHKIENITQ